MTPHIAFPAVTFAALEAELGRELEHRRRFYPERVSKGNMLQDEADWQLAIAAAWIEDLARMRAAWSAGEPSRAPRHAIAWRDRRAALLRELELRRRHYPEWVKGGRILEADAAHQLACLEALLAIYEDGWDWRGSDGLTPMFSQLADQEFAALRAEVAAREGRSQRELELEGT